jgi:hypothetical protein
VDVRGCPRPVLGAEEIEQFTYTGFHGIDMYMHIDLKIWDILQLLSLVIFFWGLPFRNRKSQFEFRTRVPSIDSLHLPRLLFSKGVKRKRRI